jgi:hypothetical protein
VGLEQVPEEEEVMSSSPKRAAVDWAAVSSGAGMALDVIGRASRGVGIPALEVCREAATKETRMSYLEPVGVWGFSTNYEHCIREADTKTQSMYDKREDVRKNWNPTGTFTPDDLQTIVFAAFNMMKEAGTGILDKALADSQMPNDRDELQAARTQIFDQESKMDEYTAVIKEARAQGITQINALGLKGFVLGAMRVTRNAAFVAAKVACERPWWLDYLVGILKVFMAAANLILSIPGIIYNAAKAALEVVDQFAKIVKYSMYAGAAVGGWWVWNKYLKKKK